jgi:hypothetical protein
MVAGNSETEYEVFAKAVGLYNGKDALSSTSWPLLLKTQVIPSDEDN